MDIDDLEPRNQPAKPKDLALFSVEDLRRYVEALKAEMTRAEDMIAKKTAQQNAAHSVFKT